MTNRIGIDIGGTFTDLVIEEKDNVAEVTKNITESLSILINKDLDLFSSTINQK